jgi:Transcriptional regulator
VAPRTYSLGKRATTSAETRQRVLDAAAALYGEHGVAATTIRAVAERADVSRGTILHHFGSPDGLLEAVLDHVVGMIDMPDERVLDGITARNERIRRFVGAMFEFYERSTSWWTVFGPEMQLPVLQAQEQKFWVAIGRFQAAAFGDLAGDRIVIAAAAGFIHPAMLGSMRAAGATMEEVIEIVGEALVNLAGTRSG